MPNAECQSRSIRGSFWHSAFAIWHLRSFKELRNLLALAKLDVGLLPVGALADEPPLALHLPVRHCGPHRFDLRPEQLLDRALDVHFRGVGRDLEHERPAGLAQQRRLLGDQRAANDICLFHNLSRINVECRMPNAKTSLPRFGIWHWTFGIYPSDSWSFSRASRVAIT